MTDFHLIETLRWEPGDRYFLLQLHLRRLSAAAQRFAIPLDRDRVLSLLEGAVAGRTGPARVRLTVMRDGGLHVEATALTPLDRLRAGLARSPVSSADELLRFKTSNREVYARARAERPGLDEVILWNERGELTETSTGNLVLELDGRKVTPPVEAGLLPGTFRAHLLELGAIEERPLPIESLRSAARVYHINSVRRWVPVEVVDA